MLRELFDEPGTQTPAALQSVYEDHIVAAIQTVGPDTAAAETDVDSEIIEQLLEGESPPITLQEATQLLALDENLPDAAAIEAESRDILLLGMSIAVLDVEAVAKGIDDQLEPKEIQQKAEGRAPMTLAEYALLHSYIASQQ